MVELFSVFAEYVDGNGSDVEDCINSDVWESFVCVDQVSWSMSET